MLTGLEPNAVDVRALRIPRQGGHTRTSVLHRHHSGGWAQATRTADSAGLRASPARTAGLQAPRRPSAPESLTTTVLFLSRSVAVLAADHHGVGHLVVPSLLVGVPEDPQEANKDNNDTDEVANVTDNSGTPVQS